MGGVQDSLTQKYVILDNANEANKTWGGGAGWVIRKHFLKMSLKNGQEFYKRKCEIYWSMAFSKFRVCTKENNLKQNVSPESSKKFQE